MQLISIMNFILATIEFFNRKPPKKWIQTHFEIAISILDIPNRRACGFQNLVWTTVYGGHNLPTPGWNRVKVAAKTWCGHVPTSTWPQARLPNEKYRNRRFVPVVCFAELV